MTDKPIKSNNDSNESQEVMSYPKNSFDRFCDDLTEVIVSYLPLKDKFRFQCLSKQWSRLVFNRQYDLSVELTGNLCYKRETLKTIVKKCPNIRSIVLPEYTDGYTPEDVDENCLTLQTITENYTKLSSIEFTDVIGCYRCLSQFFDKIGFNLTDLGINSIKEGIDCSKQLEKCLHLKSLKVKGFYEDIDWYKQSFPRLKRLEIRWNVQIDSFGDFLEKHKNIEAILFRLNDISQSLLMPDLFQTLSQLKRLKSLDIGFGVENIDQIFVELLEPIGIQCKELKQLILISSKELSAETFNNTLDLLKYFSQLKRLTIGSTDIGTELGSDDHLIRSDSFRCCPQLTHLTIDIRGNTTDFFDDISTNLPRLQYLKIHNYSDISQRMVDEVSKLSKLKVLHLEKFKNRISNYHRRQMAEKCPKLDIIQD